MLDLPAARLCIMTGTSLIFSLENLRSSKFEMGSGYSSG